MWMRQYAGDTVQLGQSSLPQFESDSSLKIVQLKTGRGDTAKISHLDFFHDRITISILSRFFSYWLRLFYKLWQKQGQQFC